MQFLSVMKSICNQMTRIHKTVIQIKTLVRKLAWMHTKIQYLGINVKAVTMSTSYV